MKKLLILCLMMSGCVTGGAPSDLAVLGEAGGIALLSYTANPSDDPEVKGEEAIKAADEYLAFSFGDNLFNQPKYTVAGLVHSEILYGLADARTRRLMFVARLVLRPNGKLTGMSWADALILGEQATPD